MQYAALLCLCLLVSGSLCPCEARAPNDPGEKEKYFNSKLLSALDPNELATALMGLARAKSPSGLDTVLASLRDRRFLARFDRDTDPLLDRLERLERVLEPIVMLPPDQANRLVLQLGSDKCFMSDGERVGALMMSCARIRRPSQSLLDFLDAQATPDSWQSNIIVPILANMRSPAACQRIEKRLLTKDASIANKKEWFTHHILEVRDDPSIVAMCNRVNMADLLDSAVRDVMLQTLFDYQPKEWYRRTTDWLPRPPNREEASKESLRDLVQIADRSLKLSLSAQARDSVLKGRKEIEKMIEFLDSGAPENIANLITALDSPSFDARNRASRELAKYGDAAGLFLRKAFLRATSTEARARIDALLSDIAVRERDAQIAGLIEDLDREDKYSIQRRSFAARKLRQHGYYAGIALWKAQHTARTEKGKERIEGLLYELDR